MKDLKAEKMDLDNKPVVKVEKIITDIKLKSQNCPICLCNFEFNSLVSSPDVCQHIFCLECLQEWSKKVNTCPIDRKTYSYIHVKNIFNQNIRQIKVEDRVQAHREEYEQDLTFCEVCRQPNREDRMLLCDSCDRGYHCECLNPVIEDIPEGEWFCPECVRSGRGRNSTATTSTNSQVRVIARTNFAERVRRNVNANRNSRSILNEIDNRVLVNRRPIRRKFTKRKRARKIKRAKRKTKTTKKNSKIKEIKKEPGTSMTKSKRKIKRRVKRKKVKRVTKRTNTKINLLNALKIKNKYKLSNKTSKERILKRIINENEKKISDSIPISEKLSNLFHGFRTLNDEDSASIQLTSQASDYFEFNESKNREKPKEVKPSTSGSDLITSILSSQKILIQHSSKIKIKHDGSMEILDDNSSKLTKPCVQSSVLNCQGSQLKRFKTEPQTSKDEKEKHEYSSENFREKLGLTKKSSNGKVLSNKYTTEKQQIISKLSRTNSEKIDTSNRNFKNEIKKEEKVFTFLKAKSEPIPLINITDHVDSNHPDSGLNINIKLGSDSSLEKTRDKKSCIANYNEKEKNQNQDFGELAEKRNNDCKIKTEKTEKNDAKNTESVQEAIALICKNTIKPFYMKKIITKDDYKLIMKKVVSKVRVHVKDLKMLNTKKVIELSLAYVDKIKNEKNTEIQIRPEIKEEIDKIFND